MMGMTEVSPLPDHIITCVFECNFFTLRLFIFQFVNNNGNEKKEKNE